ncbi:hypothetical protein [Streptomyces griseorubiginosus]|uniref:hypothetical protein n=1 Tax=Streptomyces griseorubiginosus TaxID=67304 RepID=UPI002E80A4BB|nr:hypothetical protein [Streptomyces griseorubiginosus]WUB46441.1 hypothetical protein OHN19_25155 [Streptomyces griseorubiginosus]WUB54962.1 hypothetical protein OG942_25160 [Streptomyces griseorubiginosus]
MSQLDKVRNFEHLITEIRWPLLNAFCALSESEEARLTAAKRKLLAKLSAYDPFRNSTEFEEYRPS